VAEQDEPDDLDETEHRERCRCRQRRQSQRPRQSVAETSVGGTCTSACKVSHSEAKPFKGGTPAITSEPTRKAAPVKVSGEWGEKIGASKTGQSATSRAAAATTSGI
jgi:hypothetical protein